jgi:adenine-specific DNA-methyltransferase
MDKLKMHTKNLADENYKKLAELFPDAVTETTDEEGNVIRAIDKDVLMQEINTTVVVDKQERYQFTWPDKRKAVILANEPISKTLRLDKEKSVGRDGTPGETDSENIYIEGDNLDALKLLQETYLGKVKMIYIDPPYNTGNDFLYEDDFSQSASEYADNSGQTDEEGNRMVQNNESNGRFHTDWLNMMYPRLKLAKDLLAEDGVIFISIDDNEQENLKKVCGEVFGDQNFVAQLIWERAFSPKNDAKYVSNSHDYVLMYARSIGKFKIGRLPRTAEANARYKNPDNDPRGPWMSSDISVKTYNADCDYPITTPSGRVVEPPAGRCWSLSKKAFLERLQDNRIWFGPDGSGTPRIKRFLSDLKFDGMAPTSIMFYKDVGHSQEGAQEVSKLLDGGYFSGPKPVRMLKRLMTMAKLESDSIIIDFFSGSASTAHALLNYNAEDKGHRKYILVQIPEVIDEKSEAHKAGYDTICDIGEERIRRAGKKIKEETGADIDYGFRCFKVDSSNMKDVYYNPSSYDQSQLNMFESNIKEGRTGEDLLIQVMLDLGILLSSKVEKKNVEGKEVFSVENGYLLACFDENLPESLVTEMAKQHPVYAVFRDSGMGSDSLMTNFDQIFKTYSPETVRKVL